MQSKSCLRRKFEGKIDTVTRVRSAHYIPKSENEIQQPCVIKD